MNQPVYLDYNATAPAYPEVVGAMSAWLGRPCNPSSVHGRGREARKIVEEARAKIAALVNAPAAQIVFGSGATEANNTVLKYFSGERILVSAIEHSSVLHPAPQAERIPVEKDGIIDLGALEALLKKGKTALVSLMLVNNETGIIQPVAEAAQLAKKHGALFHCDAVQAAGKIPVDIAALGVDFLTISSHKIAGPQGAGALVLGLCGITPTLLDGGGQEKMARAGTENVAGIAGFGAAADIVMQHMEKYRQQWAAHQETLEKKIMELTPQAVIHGTGSQRVANTTLFSLPDADAQTLLMALDIEGVAVSSGSACSSGTIRPSHVLEAMGAPPEQTTSAIRLSTGWATTGEDILGFLKAYEKIAARIRKA